MKEKILDKIQKLLRLSEGTSSAEEAQAALLMAQKMMVNHGIDASEVRLSEKEAEVVHADVIQTQYKGQEVNRLAQVIADNFRCIPYWRGQTTGYSRNGRRRRTYILTFLGRKEDAEIASSTFKAALRAASNLAEEHVRKGGKKKSYMLGWVQGLSEKFEAQKANDSTLALAIRVPSDVQDALDAMEGLKRGTPYRRLHLDAASHNAGRLDGLQFGTGVTSKN